MDPVPSAPTPRPLSADDLRRALERAGKRCTRQRRAVYECLCAADHPTAAQVCRAVRRCLPRVSLATVYNALEALVAARVAARLAGGPGPTRYDGRPEAHYHLRCERTGAVRDLPLPYDPRLPEKLAPGLAADLGRQGFEVTGHRLELVGHFRPR